MSIMSSRRRMIDQKEREANKQKAHSDNHKKVKEAEQSKPVKPEAVKDGSDKSAAK